MCASGNGIHHVMNPDVYRGLWGTVGSRDCPVLPEGAQPCAEGSVSHPGSFARIRNGLFFPESGSGSAIKSGSDQENPEPDP